MAWFGVPFPRWPVQTRRGAAGRGHIGKGSSPLGMSGRRAILPACLGRCSARVVCAAEGFGDGRGAPEVIALGMVDAQAAQDLDGGGVLHVLGDHLLA